VLARWSGRRRDEWRHDAACGHFLKEITAFTALRLDRSRPHTGGNLNALAGSAQYLCNSHVNGVKNKFGDYDLLISAA
jgi:hypothetical protein